MNSLIASHLGELPDNEPEDHGAQERAQIIRDAVQSAGQVDRLIAQAAFERARAEQLEIALREAHLACVQHDTQRACDILMGALRF